MKKAGILAAGEGSRLKSFSLYKPIVKINGTPLLELTFKNLHFKDFNQVAIIFNEEEKNMDFELLPSLKNNNTKYFFKSTTSSMHSLFEISRHLDLKHGEHFFVSMVDSIVHPVDAKKFQEFCLTLAEDESAVLVTRFIEDEKPLTLRTNTDGHVTEFQCPLDDESLVTSGVYYFSYDVLSFLSEMIESGHTKMRSFLSELVNRQHRIKTYQVVKTLDVDRPEDIKTAEAFIKEFESWT